MKRIDWADALGANGQTTNVPRPRAHQPFLPLDALPTAVREALEDPERPRCQVPADRYRWTNIIMRLWPDATRRGDREWSDKQLRRLGYPPGKVDGRGNDWRSYGYWDAVYFTVMGHLEGEADEHATTMKVDATTRKAEARDDEVLDRIPEEGGVGYDDLVTMTGKGRRTIEGIVARLVDEGLVEARAVPSSRGGKPRKVFVRVAEDGE